MPLDIEKFVQNIEDLCKIRQISPTKACIDSGVSRSFLTDVKNKNSTPRIDNIQKIAHYLGVTTSELLGEVPCGTVSLAHVPQEEELTTGERQLLLAYRRADERAKDMVKLALKPFVQSSPSDEAM